MTNAKSRLVRIIALALAVLMIVPMALVGCKKTTGVDQAALDAALKEALDAAQKAQDAADKAAQDAKDAQDKLAEAEKEAADLQGQIDAMKNTTAAAPATTTQAPVSEDAKVVDAYIASVVLDEESEYSKLVATYKALEAGYVKSDAEAIEALISTAEIAIRRAPSVDYVNQLIAGLKADLEAVPTFSERVKEAYDAIDFTSDVDVIDVVYAANLAAEAEKIDTDVNLGENKSKLEEADLEAVLKAEVAALNAFGADELDLATAINNEYYRYTGATKIACADTVKSVEVLYKNVFDAAKAETKKIDVKIAGIFGANVKEELKAEKIVYGTYATDIVKTIEGLYKEIYEEYKREDYASLKEDFEIAFIGESYILIEEGNYLREKLAEADARIIELEAAAKEYDKRSFKEKLEAIVTKYDTEQAKYLYTEKKNVDKVYDLLVAWMDTYNFAKDDANLNAIIGAAKYASFTEAKAYVDGVNTWAVKAEKIGAEAVENLIDEYKDNSEIGYTEFGAIALALESWYLGSYDADKTQYNADGVQNAKVKVSATKELTISAENVAEILDEVLDVAKADVESTLSYFRTTLVNKIVKDANDINKAMGKIELEGLTLDSKVEINKIKAVLTQVETYLATIACDYEVDDNGEKEYDLEDTNADLINWPAYDEICAAYALASNANVAKASDIVKAAIAAFGTVTEDGTIEFTYGAKTYEFDNIESDIITIKSYSKVKDLKAIYDAVQVHLTTDLSNTYVIIEDVEGEEVKFTFADAVVLYRQISETFYQGILEKATEYASVVRKSSFTNADTASANLWRTKFTAAGSDFDEIVTYLGEYAPEFRYVGGPDVTDADGDGNTSESVDYSSAKDGSVINVYNTQKSLYSSSTKITYSYVNAILSVDYLAYCTYGNNGAVTGFDKAGYYKAVSAALDTYYTNWQDLYVKDASENEVITTAQSLVKYFVNLGLWTIEDTFYVNEDEYKFVTGTDGQNVTIKLFDEEGEVESIKYKNEAGVVKYYELSVDFDSQYTVVSATKYNDANVAIMINEVGSADNKVSLATIVDDADVLDLTFVYEFADAADTIKAAIKLAPTDFKYIDSSSWYRFITAAWFDKVAENYAKKQFYVGTKDAFNAMTAYKNSENSKANAEGQAKIANLYGEYSNIYSAPAFGGAVTVEKAVAAYNTFKAEVDAIVKSFPAASAAQ